MEIHTENIVLFIDSLKLLTPYGKIFMIMEITPKYLKPQII